MAPRKSPKSGSPGPGARREAKHGGNKSAKKEGASGSSFFTWFMVIALLGVWTSVAVVWFELVDYEEVLGKLGIYDADGDGDFDMEDAKVLLGVKPGEIIKSKVKESAKKTKEKQQLKKDAKEEEKKKTKKKIEDFDIKNEKIDDKSKKDSHKIKQDRKTGKEKSELDKNHKDKDTKVLANDKDKEVKKLAKSLSKPSEEDKRKKPK
ncbi:aspartyl/asparaginyl beta-hydroxylase-like isoform X5 [Pseudonaja textilis]|uniref:aspartyl/asparaginyl beta-hydroxylase-like isoform X5 n=1 Tax=Pseudonaja textilis TaxID=8673 RepID=UPI000EA924C7|nr:aspartyl/asparaginyl beta-hydroxylase-like isoform X5 [Pseudonaja textilis]